MPPDSSSDNDGAPAASRIDAGATYLAPEGAVATEIRALIHAGDSRRLCELLAAQPGLAAVRIGDAEQARPLLHVATDWPGHFPNVAETIRALVDAGADVHARFEGPHAETALHWAASCDDVAAIDALLDAGADIEAPGAVLGGGSPLADACGFAQWRAAQRLVERGASTTLHHAASLGLLDRVEAMFRADGGDVPDTETITGALWYASNGGQRDTAAYLMDRGGDLNWVGWDGKTCLDVALDNEDQGLAEWLTERGARRASELAAG